MADSATQSVFGDYARFYDLFYADKDYDGEARYVAGLLTRHGRGGETLVDFGCGTGRHARAFARLGYTVVGVERSQRMLERARSQTASVPAGAAKSVEFVAGDFTSAALGRRFGAATALFHVLCYQTTDVAVRKALRIVRDHLDDGGTFVFDVWHAPAVLAIGPSLRVARHTDGRFEVTRIAEPTLDEKARSVDVHYTLFIEDRETGEIRKTDEHHAMRYFDTDELTRLARDAGLEMVACEEWMTGRGAGKDTWGVCYVARALVNRV